MAVHHRLRVPGRPGGVVHQRGIRGFPFTDRQRLRCLSQLLLEGEPPRFPLADAHEIDEAGALLPDLVHLVGLRVPADDRPRAGVLRPVDEVLRTQLVGAGDHDRPDLGPRRHAEIPLRNVLEQKQDRVARLHSKPVKDVPDPGGDPAHLPERVFGGGAFGVLVEEGHLGPVGSVPVDDVTPEIEVFGDVPLEVLPDLLVMVDSVQADTP